MGWRTLLTLPAAGAEVTVTIGATTHTLTADRGGYVHAEVGAQLSLGWHDAEVGIAGRTPVRTRVRIVDAQEPHGVVSDIDDTVLVTWVPRPLLAAWNTFILREHARRPVPGMDELLRRLAGEHGFMVYLSTGAWNFAPHLERFMAEHGFPPGPFFLTDWRGPTSEGWFRSGAAHKRATLERLRREHPHTKWVLVGDDGQRDPEVYAEFATAHPDAVTAASSRSQKGPPTSEPVRDAPAHADHQASSRIEPEVHRHIANSRSRGLPSRHVAHQSVRKHSGNDSAGATEPAARIEASLIGSCGSVGVWVGVLPGLTPTLPADAFGLS